MNNLVFHVESDCQDISKENKTSVCVKRVMTSITTPPSHTCTASRLQTLDEFLSDVTSTCGTIVSCNQVSSSDQFTWPAQGMAKQQSILKTQMLETPKFVEAPPMEIMHDAPLQTKETVSGASLSSVDEEEEWIVLADTYS